MNGSKSFGFVILAAAEFCALVLVLMGFVSKASPPALNPAVPRSTCADLRTAVERGAAVSDEDVKVVTSSRFEFRCDPGVMRGAFVCDDISFPADRIPTCTPGSVDRFDKASDLLVTPLAGGHVSVDRLCLGCKLGVGKGAYTSKADVALFKTILPVAIAVAVVIPFLAFALWIRKKKSAA